MIRPTPQSSGLLGFRCCTVCRACGWRYSCPCTSYVLVAWRWRSRRRRSMRIPASGPRLPLVKLAETGLGGPAGRSPGGFGLRLLALGVPALVRAPARADRAGPAALALGAGGRLPARSLLEKRLDTPGRDRHASKTDILILGTGGAGLFAALHALQANPDLDVTVAVKGLLGKCGCTRMVQGGYNVALAPEDSVERHFMDTIRGREVAAIARIWPGGSGRDRGRADPRAGERDRLLLRPQPGRLAAPEGLRRADLRPHGAQGRPDRDRDHQPPDPSRSGPAVSSAGWKSTGRSRWYRPRTGAALPAC